MPTPPPPRASLQKHHPVPPGTGTFGMILFLASLTMLFGASMLGYVLIRLNTEAAPVAGEVHLPLGLWASTAILLASSYTIHQALQYVRHERQMAFRKAMTLTLLLAIGFVLVQTPSLVTLLRDHFDQPPGPQSYRLYGLMFTFILIHALHVLGGVIPLALVTRNAHAHAYDHERYGPVKYLAMYWHFLDAVWIVMFAIFLIAN